MKVRSIHRIIGIILLIPFFCWALTGLVFFLKPGYVGAYEVLAPRTYPGGQAWNLPGGWREVRYVKTVLGDHLIVREDDGWRQLDPFSLKPRPKPTEAETRALLNDAFTVNPQRYGEVASISDSTIKTSTGIEVTLDWSRLTLQQKGKDTDRIDMLYRIHYLQWTGVKSVDRVVGLIGISLVLILTTLGAWLALKKGA